MAKILELGGRNRKLAAILHADVAGFSRLMGLDEAGTHRVLGEFRRAVDPLIASYGGRIVGTAGAHSLLADFPLAPLNAVWMCGPNDGDHLLAPILCLV
jgi:class 3 adenylate cyclase